MAAGTSRAATPAAHKVAIAGFRRNARAPRVLGAARHTATARGLPAAALVICAPRCEPDHTKSVPMAIRIVRTMSALRRAAMRWRVAGERIALVPTMGALHGGHLPRVRAARPRAPRGIVSVLVHRR